MASLIRNPLLYVLHSSNLYGTERIALDTAAGLADTFEPVLFGPPGPAMDEAEKLGLEARRFRGAREFARVLRPFLKAHRSLTFVATGVVQSAVCIALNAIYFRKINHIHIVHGGAAGAGSYGRKKWLNHANVTFVTVSQWARETMIANGVRADRIEVVPNFLPPQRVASAPRRGPYVQPGIRRVLVVSRMDPLKRVGVLLDALDHSPAPLAEVSFRILGLGPEMKTLVQRAKAAHPNVEFAGFSANVPAELAAADLLVHTCPVESFGLAVLEGMAANLATLVPDKGGAGLLVEECVSGFKFRADDPASLAERLIELKDAPAEKLNRAVAGGRIAVDKTYSAEAVLDRYRQLFARK
ncbi:MAG: glycosyltransferase family 4 protein [Planctomycetota bacterium]|nr:glycosyltransferase family 4 protein [Planctomycetota bacterium]